MGKRMEETMKLYDSGVYLVNGNELVPDGANAIEEVVKKTGAAVTKEQAAENTIAYGILKNHNTSGNMDKLQIKFDKLTSHDITFVGIIQTARASGLEKFSPVPKSTAEFMYRLIRQSSISLHARCLRQAER